jgi:hypothetical protein
LFGVIEAKEIRAGFLEAMAVLDTTRMSEKGRATSAVLQRFNLDTSEAIRDSSLLSPAAAQ